MFSVKLANNREFVCVSLCVHPLGWNCIEYMTHVMAMTQSESAALKDALSSRRSLQQFRNIPAGIFIQQELL